MKTKPIEIEDDLIVIEREINEAIKSIIMKRKGSFAPNKSENLPPTDVYICNDSIKIEIELPGIAKEDIEIIYVNPFLSVKGLKRNPIHSSKIKYHCIECIFGRFQRIIELPCAVNIKNAKAKLVNGILSIVLPKVYERREIRKRILID